MSNQQLYNNLVELIEEQLDDTNALRSPHMSKLMADAAMTVFNGIQDCIPLFDEE